MSRFDVERLRGRRALVVGDLMLDEYVVGAVDRISPEAPVPVVHVESESFTLGGAGNVAANLAALGAAVSVAGVIGTAADGDRVLERFAALGVDAAGVVRDPDRPTTRKTRVLAGSQQVLRVDRETRREIADAPFEALIRFVADRAPEVEVILISDYGKGVVTRPLLSAVLSAAETRNVPVIADPKGRDFSRYAGVTLLTPNRKEAGEAVGADVSEMPDLLATGRTLLETSGVKNLLVTCGPEGMVLFERDREPHLISAEARAVFDVSGAGDTVAAVLGLGVAAGLHLPEAAALANTAAGIVVGKVGTATLTRRELSDALRPSGDPLAAKLRTLDEIGEAVRSLRQAGKKVVLTNGCFDLLHAGHIRLFFASRALGDALIVALDDDESVRRVKGDGRPVLRAEERVRVLGALDSVDFLVVFASDDLERLIETVRPDVLTKGGNYAPEAVRGHALVEELGGRVERISVVEAVSATEIINAIRKG